jgi:oligoendopeptidase F
VDSDIILRMTKLDTSKTEWDLSPLLAGDDDPKIKAYRKTTTKVVDAFANKWRDRDDYLQDPKILKEALSELEALERIDGLGNESYYFQLEGSLDSENSKIKAGSTKATEFDQEMISRMRFFFMRVAQIPEGQQKKFLQYEGLMPYRHWLERSFAEAKYQLSEPEEKILSLKAPVSHGLWHKMTQDAFSRSERKVTQEDGTRSTTSMTGILALIDSNSKSVRDGAAVAFNDILATNLQMAVTEFNAILLNKKINDELRGYQRPDSGRLLNDDMDSEVIDALLAAVQKRNSIPGRYYELKARLLGLDKLAYHERNLEVGKVNKKYPFPEASQLVYDVFSNIDPEFSNFFTDYLQNGQIDVYPKTGKRGGAFCAGSGAIKLPTYIMLNHTDQLSDVMTLAHELGHGINNEMMRQKQNALNFSVPMATAEVASTFFEGVVFDQLLAKSDEELELIMRMGQLNQDVSSVFRQIAFYAFEQEVHAEFRKQGYLPAQELGRIFRKHMEAYMGEAVEQSPGSENWWAYVPHFRTFFYVYSYASGKLISMAMRKQLEADEGFVVNVKQFLSAGFSKSPKDVFADMKIDITDTKFWESGIDGVEEQLDQAEALAKKLGKI